MHKGRGLGLTGVVAALAAGAGAGACSGGGDAGSPCGPTRGTVARVIDGDTIELVSGERIRYLLVDTPESTGGATDCFGVEARTMNEQVVAGKDVTIVYDEAACTDRFDRLLAYVSVDGREINRLLVERGYGCVLYIPPAGGDRREEFETLEAEAKLASAGLWGACLEVTCD